jgi:hypothetical protein
LQQPVHSNPPADDAVAAKCRNCGATAAGAFCPACGQETQVRLPTFMQFMKDAAGRYVALDGKGWKTFAALIFRPGFLTREYLAGRRRRYVRPSRLFLVAILLLFAVMRLETGFGRFDVVKFDVEAPGSPQAQSVTPEDKARAAVELDDVFQIEFGKAESAIPLLGERLARFRRLSGAEKAAQLTDGTLRYGSYAMLVLLPAFAAMLKIVYLGSARRRPRRPRLYGEHLIFAAHNTAFLAFWASVAFVLPESLKPVAILWPFAYLLWSMRVVYGGSWAGTIARAGVLFLSYSVLFGLAIVGLVMAAVVLR